jgi:hypothetical protein
MRPAEAPIITSEADNTKALEKMSRVAEIIRKISHLHDTGEIIQAESAENDLYRQEFPGHDVPYPEIEQ